MVTFSFITQGLDVGYGEDGFFAFGGTDNHRWHDRDYLDAMPPLHGEVIEWRIDTRNKSQWDQYKAALTPEQITPRKDVLNEFWSEYGVPCGRMQRSRFEPNGVFLIYSLPSDPALAVFFMSALTAGRELTIFCPDAHFIDGDGIAPAPSVVGFQERGEPAFLHDKPILRLR